MKLSYGNRLFPVRFCGFFSALLLSTMNVGHAAQPLSAPGAIAPTVQSITVLSGTASADAEVVDVNLTIRDDDLNYYWNGIAFQSAPIDVPAVITGSGNSVSWHYDFTRPLPVGQYTVSSVAIDDNDQRQSTPASESFAVASEFISTGDGSWGPVIQTPSIAVAAANLPDGKILHWAAYKVDDYKPSSQDFQQTYTSIFDPVTGQSTLDLVTETEHDMFCMGANILEDGRVLMNGGNSHGQTSIFDSANGNWISEDPMNIPRAYQGNTMLEDGRVLTLGGSWKFSDLCRGQTDNSGTCVDKTAEIWDPDGGWSVLPGISPNPLLTDDIDGIFRSDNHMWLFTVPGGKVLHAGPSRNMHLLDVSGNGSVTPVGTRADDADAMNGNAVMVDVGKILTVGGAPNYENDDATTSAFVIEVNGDNVTSRRVGSMASRRAYHNSVVLPNGEVIVVGGQAYPAIFSDAQSAMQPELWNPVTETFRELVPMQVPRNYHSVALLTQDGRVLAGGGGLCGTCDTKNHSDIEILTPPYLFDSSGNLAPRPAILSAPTSTTYGNVITVKTDTPIHSLVLMRASAVTHSVNNAQRRIPLDFTVTTDNNNLAVIPTDSGAVIPGNYMLFALDSNGVPSVATSLNVRHDPSNQDTDGDGIPDSEDPFPLDPDNDIDGDGISGHIDNCPTDSNPDQSDIDGDGIGDVCDPVDDTPDAEFSAQLMDNRFDVCIEVADASTAPGANVQASTCSSGPSTHQIFDFLLIEGSTDTYTIHPHHSGLCLDVEGGSTSDRASIIQSTCSAGLSQRFRLTEDGNTYTINTSTGDGSKVFDASADLEPDGVSRNLQQFSDASKGNQRWTFFIQENEPDSTAPTGLVTTPANDGDVLTPDTIISGTASDAGGSGIEAVEVAIRDLEARQWIDFTGGYSDTNVRIAATLINSTTDSTDWNLPVTLDQGSYRVQVVVFDGAGNNSGWIKKNFVISVSDTDAPQGDITSPANNGDSLPESAVLSGTATDSGASGFDKVEVAIRDLDAKQWLDFKGGYSDTNVRASATLTNTTTESTDWNLPVTLDSGAYRVQVVVFDGAGNNSGWIKKDFVVNVSDTDAPHGDITSPANNGDSLAQTAVISGTATDTGASGFDKVEVAIRDLNAKQWIDFTGGYSDTNVRVTATLTNTTIGSTDWNLPVTLEPGNYRVQAVVFDNARNNSGWIKKDFVVNVSDANAPQGDITSPADNGDSLPQTAVISGTATDTGASGFDKVEVAIRDLNAKQWIDFTGGYSDTNVRVTATLTNTTIGATDWNLPVTLEPGNYRVQAVVFDNARNNSGWIKRDFVVE